MSAPRSIPVPQRVEDIPAVRRQIGEAVTAIAGACATLRQAGFPESARDLERQIGALRVWTQKDGWLDWLEKPAGDTTGG